MRLNPDSAWSRMPRWKKRIYCFITYLAAACMSICEPEGTDHAMLESLREQFLED